MRERENERREGKVKEKIVEVLGRLVAGRDQLEELDEPEKKSLAVVLHEKIGGPTAFPFGDMFRELHRLWCMELEPSGSAFKIVEKIYFSAHSLDVKNFRDRRK